MVFVLLAVAAVVWGAMAFGLFTLMRTKPPAEDMAAPDANALTAGGASYTDR